jgi:imidazoleglycerol-phosphate dehydratase / histidinol-phosphatase
MKPILVDKNFFSLPSTKSAGLITGLKKLSAFGFDLYIFGVKEINKSILSLVELENVQLNEASGYSGSYNYVISAAKTSKKNSMVVGINSNVKSFFEAAESIVRKQRSAKISRKTKETSIDIEIELDGDGKSKISSGIGFFDHMLEQIARHANVNLFINIKGDLHIDEHHTVEDTGIALGNAIKNALGDKLGIKRYGFFLPMDDSTASCALDFGGRSYLNFNCKFSREKVGEFPTELVEEFFRGLAGGLAANLFLKATGKNDHHKIEAMFKAFAKSLNEACRMDERAKNSLPSTKGLL